MSNQAIAKINPDWPEHSQNLITVSGPWNDVEAIVKQYLKGNYGKFEVYPMGPTTRFVQYNKPDAVGGSFVMAWIQELESDRLVQS